MSTVEKDLLNRSDLEGLVQERERELVDLKARLSEWEESYDGTTKREDLFTTISGREVKPLYTALDQASDEEAIGFPGTDIWTNNMNWKPRPMCKNGMPCHVSAPRGAKTGTQGLKNNYERSKLPKELCVEIVKNCTIGDYNDIIRNKAYNKK